MPKLDKFETAQILRDQIQQHITDINSLSFYILADTRKIESLVHGDMTMETIEVLRFRSGMIQSQTNDIEAKLLGIRRAKENLTQMGFDN